LLALIEVIAEVPEIVKVAFVPCAKLPVPLSAVATVRLLLFVRETPVTVTFGIENVPVND
jgi:hypothetical protein